MTKTQAIVDAAIVGLLIVAYVVLTALNHDGTPILYLIAGAGGRSAVQSTVAAATKDTSAGT